MHSNEKKLLWSLSAVIRSEAFSAWNKLRLYSYSKIHAVPLPQSERSVIHLPADMSPQPALLSSLVNDAIKIAATVGSVLSRLEAEATSLDLKGIEDEGPSTDALT